MSRSSTAGESPSPDGEDAAGMSRSNATGARAVLGYSLARLLVFVVVTAALYLAGLRGVLLVLVAVVGSGLVSYILLAPQRAAMGAAVQRGLSRRRSARRDGAPRGLRARIAASAAAEDAYVDALERDAGPSGELPGQPPRQPDQGGTAS